MSANNYNAWFAFCELPQFDGQPLHRTVGDPGGDTSWGWTYTTWQNYCYWHGGDASLAAFSAMTKDQFKVPSRIQFWNTMSGDSMPSGVDLFWCDFHFGSGGANRVLQGVVGTLVDGLVGTQTVLAAKNAAPGLIDRMLEARLAYYQTLGFPQFINGWANRAIACAKAARLLPGAVT